MQAQVARPMYPSNYMATLVRIGPSNETLILTWCQQPRPSSSSQPPPGKLPPPASQLPGRCHHHDRPGASSPSFLLFPAISGAPLPNLGPSRRHRRPEFRSRRRPTSSRGRSGRGSASWLPPRVASCPCSRNRPCRSSPWREALLCSSHRWRAALPCRGWGVRTRAQGEGMMRGILPAHGSSPACSPPSADLFSARCCCWRGGGGAAEEPSTSLLVQYPYGMPSWTPTPSGGNRGAGTSTNPFPAPPPLAFALTNALAAARAEYKAGQARLQEAALA